jgi:micrococcal nuclease
MRRRYEPLGSGLRGTLLAGALALGLAGHAQATDREVVGPVVRVVSGDTLVVASGEGELEVRLADIGAPQGGAYFAPGARTMLASIVGRKPVRVRVTGDGGPARVFGRAYVGELDVNTELVRRGAAWVCLEYAADTGLFPWERDARRHRRGLWTYTWDIDTLVECRRRPPAERPLTRSR